MIKIERLRFRYIWSMMTRSIHECWHLRTNKCVRTNICKKSVFVVSVRNINICGRILTQFTGLLRTNTVAAKCNLLAELTGLGKSVSVSLRKNGPHSNLRREAGKKSGYRTDPNTTKFAPVKSLDSSEFSSEFSDLKTLTSNVKVNPVISWNGRNSFLRIFPSNSQDFTTPHISFEFSGFYYNSNSFLIQPLRANDRKTCPFREILSQRKGTGEDRVEWCGQSTTKNWTQII